MTSLLSPGSAKPFVIVHDFLIQMGGAERVVESVAQASPDAPIYTSATFGGSLFPVFRSNRVRNTWMQFLPGMMRHHKKLYFLYPIAFRSVRLPENAIAWISSSSFSKWIPKPDGACFVCYCHTPPRYFWNPDEYLRNEIGNPMVRYLVRKMMPLFRLSDRRQSRKINLFIANSENVRERIRECYGRESLVVYPPVDVERFQCSPVDEDFYLIVSRLVSYKRIELAVKAMTKTGKKLIIVGDGPDRQRLESLAGPNIIFEGRASDERVSHLMETCCGFIFPGLEDFGITPVEAQACGKPIIAFHGGGALETVVEGKTGVFFRENSPESLEKAVDEFENITWDKSVIRKNAERFSTERFLEKTQKILQVVEDIPIASTFDGCVIDSLSDAEYERLKSIAET